MKVYLCVWPDLTNMMSWWWGTNQMQVGLRLLPLELDISVKLFGGQVNFHGHLKSHGLVTIRLN